MITREELSKIISNLPNIADFDSIIDELEKTIGEFEEKGYAEDVDWKGKYYELEDKYRRRFADTVLETKKETEDIVKNVVEKTVENLVEDIDISELDFDGSTES